MAEQQEYVSRGGHKFASVADKFNLDFVDCVVLDVGSSTGGFTDYALQHGATKVIAVDAGTDQLHPKLQGHPAIELHERTDIRAIPKLSAVPDIVVIDVSFISLREILPSVFRLSGPETHIIAMCKPQFEVVGDAQKHKGIIKNDRMRRAILKQFESWAQRSFIVLNKADSAVPGTYGNRERFYYLRVK
jgi:23S rRNA (cytidine1920-2'-O)/16S rRNA (cytidine1409-2'-O)-methyltransferase